MTTRVAEIARMHDMLSDLATNASWTAAEDSYGYPLTDAIFAITGDTDIDDVEDEDLLALRMSFEAACLQKLRNYYIVQVDISVGPRRESLNQILQAIDVRLKQVGVAPPVMVASPLVLDELDLSGGEIASLPPNWFELGYTLL